MTKRTMLATLAALTIISLAASPPLAQNRRPLQPDDIFEIKNVGDPRISPDGQWIAYTVSTLDRVPTPTSSWCRLTVAHRSS